MATSLLALLDDIATVLDDVALMTKVAVRKTAGVLGDDLALNVKQVTGVSADRELPVVWAVAKGSFVNKLILVPLMLGLSAFLPMTLTPLLMLGGAWLCYEGFEKISARFLHPHIREKEKAAVLAILHDPDADMMAFEKNKIRGAIRTDFVLSAEIIVITMSTVQSAPFTIQAAVVTAIAMLMIVCVYGLVAAIIRMDDLGLYLLDTAGTNNIKRRLGSGLLSFSPMLMKALTFIGTAAMFLVGGGILAHGTGLDTVIAGLINLVPPLLTTVTEISINLLLGIIAGGFLLPVVSGMEKIYRRLRPPA